MLIDDYIDYSKKYKDIYGIKTVVLMQVGSFFEFYGIPDKKLGCDVDIVVSGNHHQIDIPHEIKYNLKGFSFSYNSDGSINKFKTFLNSDFSTFLKDIKLNCKDYDRVISDFEPITAWASKIQSCKSFGISNQYSFLSKKLPRPNNVRYLDEFIIKNFDVFFIREVQRFKFEYSLVKNWI
jgi:hypothetical protein